MPSAKYSHLLSQWVSWHLFAIWIYYEDMIAINLCTFHVLILEESLAQNVSMLLLELLLQTHQPEKALPQINYIEQQFISTSPATVSKLTGEKDLRTPDKTEKEKNVSHILHLFILIFFLNLPLLSSNVAGFFFPE